ncbi:hypothetical protein AB990_04360 [Alkalihalobacillus pseudalcaliphilus]|nr:hypothetical protein AB990_04360 [Alkalihalobacillus pseudalcaliphilus]
MVLSLVAVIVVISCGFIVVYTLVSGKLPAQRPYNWTFIFFSALLLHLLAFFSGFYATLPTSISDLIFIPMWCLLTGLGAFMSYKELSNNRLIAIGTSAITMILFLFTFLVIVVAACDPM